MAEAVLDASALIAFLRQEPGADKVNELMTRSCLSTVNLAETLGKMVEYGKPLDEAAFQIERLRIPVLPFDNAQARIAASLWKPTRTLGLSLGDRACLALASTHNLAAITAEKLWGQLDVGVRVVLIR